MANHENLQSFLLEEHPFTIGVLKELFDMSVLEREVTRTMLYYCNRSTCRALTISSYPDFWFDIPISTLEFMYDMCKSLQQPDEVWGCATDIFHRFVRTWLLRQLKIRSPEAIREELPPNFWHVCSVSSIQIASKWISLHNAVKITEIVEFFNKHNQSIEPEALLSAETTIITSLKHTVCSPSIFEYHGALMVFLLLRSNSLRTQPAKHFVEHSEEIFQVSKKMLTALCFNRDQLFYDLCTIYKNNVEDSKRSRRDWYKIRYNQMLFVASATAAAVYISQQTITRYVMEEILMYTKLGENYFIGLTQLAVNMIQPLYESARNEAN